MATKNHSEQLRRLIDGVVADARSRRSRFPHQLLFALADARVQEALDQRFHAGQVLSDVSTLPVQEGTGLLPLCLAFDFTPSLRLPQNCMLILLDHTTAVVGIDEQYVPVRPNPHVALLTPEDRIPFALVTSGSGKLKRVIPEATLKRLHTLELDFIAQHGILTAFYPSEGTPVDGGTRVVLDTECTVPVPFTYDTVYTIIDESTGASWQETLADNGVDYQSQTDDSEAMSLDDLLGRLG